nr:MAG TPA: hypothetical protein [Caudoviricetes sp.]
MVTQSENRASASHIIVKARNHSQQTSDSCPGH